MWSKKKVVDERIQKETNGLCAKMFYVINILTLVSLVVKLICQVPLYVYVLEILALVASIGYALIGTGSKGVLFVKAEDEAIKTIQNQILTTALMINFWIIIVGELVFLFAAEEYLVWVCSFFAIWLVPALIITIVSIKKGLFIWGGKKREAEGKKNFKMRVAIGAALYGIIVGFPMFYRDGTFHAEGVLWMLGLGAFWGILFYLLFVGMMKVSEKKADKDLEVKELESEE